MIIEEASVDKREKLEDQALGHFLTKRLGRRSGISKKYQEWAASGIGRKPGAFSILQVKWGKCFRKKSEKLC